MKHGGARENSGRKKIGEKQVKVTLSEEILIEIEKKFKGNSQAEKIRKCLIKGIEKVKEINFEK